MHAVYFFLVRMGWDPACCFSPPKRQCLGPFPNATTAPAPPAPPAPPSPAHKPAPKLTTAPTPENTQEAAPPGEACVVEEEKEEEDACDEGVDTLTIPLSDSAAAFLAALGGQPSLFPAPTPPRCPDAPVSAPPPPLHAGTLAEPSGRGPPGLLREEGGVLAYMSNMHR